MEIGSDHISNADQVSVSEPEPAPSVGTGSFSRTVTPSVERAQPYPNPRNNHCNYYMEEWESHVDGDNPFLAEDAFAEFSPEREIFIIRKKRPGDEISVKQLGAKSKELFLGKDGSRNKEWSQMLKPLQNPDGTFKSHGAVKVHRGKRAAEL